MNLDVRLLLPGLPLHMPEPFTASLGGSETAGLQLAAELARDHTVTLFGNVEQPGLWRKVNIVPYAGFDAAARSVPSDLTIVQRAPTAFAPRLCSKVNFLWVHDLLFARRKGELLGSLHSIDRIVTVSDWQKRQYQQVGGDLPDSLFLVARNGIDLDLVAKAKAEAGPRDHNLLACCCRPERGVDVLLTKVFPLLLQANPELRLALATYDCPNPQLEPFYADMARIAAGYGDRIEWHGALGKAGLYALLHRAGAYVYPTPSPGDPSFEDTSCIAVMEAMACGCPVVASDRGALPETLGDAAELIEIPPGGHAAAHGVPETFANAVVGLMTSPARWDRLHHAGLARAAGLGWAPVAKAFVDEALAILRRECSDPVRLARHFIRRQDIEAARITCAAALNKTSDFLGNPFPEDEATLGHVQEIQDWIDRRYAHAEDPNRLAAYYAEKVGPNNEAVFNGLMQAPAERFKQAPFVRFQAIDDKIRQHLQLAPFDPRPTAAAKPNGKAQLRILDFGCSQGECPIALANRLHAKVLGVDASWSEMARARQLADAKAERPKDLTFAVANETDLDAVERAFKTHGPFDVLVMAEVLEHLIDPISLVRKLEAMVRPGGIVVLTLPYGPWETQQPEHLRGQHLREWTVSDFRDLFGHKPGFILDIMPLATCPVSGEILGNTVVSYVADQTAPGQISWQRKLTTQRPRQTLAATMIVGGATAHETLHWCLTPVMDVADELIVADCGITPETKRILDQYGARIIKAPSPLAEGFEVPRNATLAQARTDWVLMIDSDERLVAPAALWRYLRENVHQTYALEQHHFAVDAQWKPDMPGRVFRRRPDGRGRHLRFFGKLHEHAEFGINEGAGNSIVLRDVRIAHVGYIEQTIRANRFIRNLPLLKADLEAYPDRKLGLLVLCRDSLIQAKWLCLISGIDHTQPGCAMRLPQAAHLCRDVVQVWERVFMEDASGMSHEALEHYHEACRMLGTEVVGDVAPVLQRQGIGSSHGHAVTKGAHFASVEHWRRYQLAQIDATTAALQGAGF